MFDRRYSHVPLAAACMLLVIVAIGWLVVHRLDGWDLPWQFGAPSPEVVPLPSSEPSTTPPPLDRPPATRPRSASAPTEVPPETARAAPLVFVLESGPFGSPEVAEQMEDRLNRLGHTTVRFRQQDTTRLYVVSLTGFAAREEAVEAARLVGRGSVIDGPDGPEVTVAQLRSLGEAVAAARPLRDRGLDVRISEALAPTVLYHLRYGRFEQRGEAQALREELARNGIVGRVVSLAPPLVRAR